MNVGERRVVMISSTARDLPKHREEVRRACERVGFSPREMMENLPAQDAGIVERSLKMVEDADVYLGIFAFRYGTVLPGQTASVSELEYDHAVKLGKPRLIFFADESHPITRSDVEVGDGAARLEQLKKRIGYDRVAAFYKSPEDLRACVVEALGDLARDHPNFAEIGPRKLGAERDEHKGLRQSQSVPTRPIRVGCFPYPPLSEWESPTNCAAESEITGPWSQLAKVVLKNLHLPLEFRRISASDFADKPEEQFDVVIGLFRTRHRDRGFEFSNPTHRVGLNGVCKAEIRGLSKDSLAEGNFKIVVQRGEVGWEYAKNEFKRVEALGRLTEISAPSTSQAIDMLLSGKYDIAITDELSCKRFLNEIGDEHPFRIAFERPIQIYDACFAFSKQFQWPMEDIESWITLERNRDEFLKDEVVALRGLEGLVERCGLL